MERVWLYRGVKKGVTNMDENLTTIDALLERIVIAIENINTILEADNE